jgi:hypothetical protein
MALRVEMAKAAQGVYDEWQQDEDDDLGGGGICQDIAEAISGVIYSHIPRIEAGTVSASCGEQHVWVVLYNRINAYEIDIPYYIYERGSGYSWTKIQGVVFRPENISISPIGRGDAKNAIENPW